MIVVTGAAGFIGSCILARLNDLGRDDIIAVDHFEPNDGKLKNTVGKRYAAYLDKAVFLEKIRRDDLKESIDCVIHMGACSSTTGTDAAYYEQNNFEYTRHVAQWCFSHRVPFIYASSASTYGNGDLGYDDDEARIPQLQPLNLYGWSKQKFDCWVLEQGVRDQVVGLKFFNVFGPNEYHKGEMRSVINKAYPVVAREGKISLFKSYRPDFADGEQKRDFIYIRDAVDVVIFFYEHPEIHGIYNVGTGLARSWNDLAKAMFAAVGKPAHIDYVEMPVSLREHYQYFTQASVDKLRQAGFKSAFMSLEEAVKDYVRYLSTNSYL